MAGSLEVQIAEAITLTSPDHAAAAYKAKPLPGEGFVLRRRVGILQIVDEPVVVVFGAGVTGLLDGSGPNQLRREISVRELVTRHVLGELAGRYFASGLQDQHFEARFGELFRCPSTTCS